jgi:hypothetical protein
MKASESTSEPVDITTVGALRKALDDVPDDRPIFCQVVAVDGTVWTTPAEFIQHGKIAAIILRHPDLKTLPKD